MCAFAPPPELARHLNNFMLVIAVHMLTTRGQHLYLKAAAKTDREPDFSAKPEPSDCPSLSQPTVHSAMAAGGESMEHMDTWQLVQKAHADTTDRRRGVDEWSRYRRGWEKHLYLYVDSTSRLRHEALLVHHCPRADILCLCLADTPPCTCTGLARH